VTSKIRCILEEVAHESIGVSTLVARAMLMARPPSIDAHETTEKGSINQKAVLANRSALVEMLYAEPPLPGVITIAGVL
jgi:feruloyl-CoA synthase